MKGVGAGADEAAVLEILEQVRIEEWQLSAASSYTGGIKKIMKLVKTHASDAVCYAACTAMIHFARRSDTRRQAIVDAGGIGMIMAVLYLKFVRRPAVHL